MAVLIDAALHAPRTARALATLGFGAAIACFGVALSSPAARAAEAPAEHHLIYLHGRIVQEQQSAKPVHPAFGVYDLDALVAAFRARGFTVHAAIRPKGESIGESAARTTTEIRDLLEAGVPVERIALVGASMGASIALEIAQRLALPELRVVLLGACLAPNVEALRAAGGRGPSGRILAIREASDESTRDCARWTESANSAALEGRELEVETGLRHGFLYRPLPAWVEPTIRWLRPIEPASDSARGTPLPDPLAAGWRGVKVCELLEESERQRALRCTFPPGVGHERHVHAPHFGYALAGGRMRIDDARGRREVELATGSSFTSDGGEHEVVNVGTTTVVYLIVEPKSAAATP